MIVHRSVWNVKLGRSGEAVELLKRPKQDLGIPYRALYGAVAMGLRVAVEVEFQDYAALEKGLPEFQKKFLGSLRNAVEGEPLPQITDVFESWHSREIWTVIE